jgi:hypothetical protein
MLKVKRLIAIMFMALLMSLCAPQAFAGFIPMGITGPTETPGLNGEMGTPPAASGEMSTPGLYGDMATGLYAAIISFFG